MLPFAELFVGGFVLAGVMPVLWSFLALGIMVVSTAFVLYGLVKQKKMDDCGCFGVAFKVPLTWWKFTGNLVWIALAAVLFWSSLGKGI